jgi:hypothetical protein
MIYGPYIITQNEWNNWEDTTQKWKQRYDEFVELMCNNNWGDFEIPSHLQLYHNLVYVTPDGCMIYSQTPDLKIEVYILTRDVTLTPTSEFRSLGGKK